MPIESVSPETTREEDESRAEPVEIELKPPPEDEVPFHIPRD